MVLVFCEGIYNGCMIFVLKYLFILEKLNNDDYGEMFKVEK
jgi:hypothetical protein